MRTIITLLIPILSVIGNIVCAQVTESYIMQTDNFNQMRVENNDNPPSVGTENDGDAAIKQYAYDGTDDETPGAAAFRTFTVDGDDENETERPLEVGDEFKITVFTDNNPSEGGRIGISFRNTTSYDDFSNSTDDNTVARFQLDENGGWNIYSGSSQEEMNGDATPGSDRTLKIKVTSSNTFNATIDGTTYYNIEFGTSGPIESFSVYTYGKDNPDSFWKNSSLKNTGSVEFAESGEFDDTSINGIISDGVPADETTGTSQNSVIIDGSGTIKFSGDNTYTGSTTLNSGTLQLGDDDVIPDVSNIILNGGTLSTGNLNSYSDTLGTLTLSDNSKVLFNINSSLTFDASDSETWSNDTLEILNWELGTTILNVGSDDSGLTSDQLSNIEFTQYGTGAKILNDGETIPDAFFANAPGKFSNASVWYEGSVPSTGDSVYIVDDIILDQDIELKLLNITYQGVFLASDSKKANRNLTIQDGGTLSNTIEANFDPAGGKVVFDGDGTITGPLNFNEIEISGGVNFSSNSTILNVITIKDGGYADSGKPEYNPNSTLIFDTEGEYSIDDETNLWTSSSAPNPAIPDNVALEPDTELNIYDDRGINGDLIINSDGTVNQGDNTFIVEGDIENHGTFSMDADAAERLVVKGDLTNQNGATIALSEEEGGGLQLEGDYQSDGTVNFNDRAIYFEGGNNQSVTGNNNPINYDVLNIAKSGGKVTFNQNVIVNDAYDQSNGDAEIASNKELVIDASAEADIASGSTLTTNDNLTIKSDASSTGSLIANGTLSGDATMQRYIAGHSGNNSTGWHLISPPVSSVTVNGSDFDPGNNDDLYSWSESDYEWKNYKADEFTDMDAGTGYLGSYESTSTKEFTGTLNNSDNTHNDLPVSTDGNGWHLLGNPFPSALHWEEDDDWSISNFATGAKIMNPGGSYTDISAGGENQYIPAHQGFFVQATEDGSNSITIPKADREHSSTSFYKSEVNNLLTLKASQGAKYVETWLQMKEGATVEYDEEYDIRFLGGMEGTPYLYSIADNEEQLSTNRIPEDINDTQIPLGFSATNDGEVTLEWDNIDSFMNEMDISITDLQENKTIDLNNTDNYTFTASSEDDPERFILNFKSTTSIEEQNNELEGVNIYSYDDQIYISSGKELTNGQYSIYNTVGQQVHKDNFTSGDKVVSISQKGTFIVRIQADEGTSTKKVIIQ